MTTNHLESDTRATRFMERAKNLDCAYRRGGNSNLAEYAKASARVPQPALYTPRQAQQLIQLNVEQRMKVKISDHYNALVSGACGVPPSKPLANLVTARGEEVADMSGEIDPSNQLKFSPVKGLLHKYDMALAYVARTCSAHCRYCYRSDLFSGISGKSLAKPDEVAEYIRSHNSACRANGGLHPNNGRPELREVLLSGGDPMVLSNSKLARWLSRLAEAGVRNIRIGTKELAFFPERFDKHLFQLLDAFHNTYPSVHLIFVVHFTHPDEFLVRDKSGQYLQDNRGYRAWLPTVEKAVAGLRARGEYVSTINQTPIIRGVNDDAQALHVLQRELFSHRIGNHYFFQCRPIQGYRAFTRPVEHTLRLFTESKRHLSGVESTARLVMSTERGKTEVCGVTSGPNGVITFRLLRSPGAAEGLGDLAIARRNPDAYWVDDYQNHVIDDPAGLILASPLKEAAE